MRVFISLFCLIAVTTLMLVAGCSSEKEEEQDPAITPPKVEIPAESSAPGEVAEPPTADEAKGAADDASPADKEPAAVAGKPAIEPPETEKAKPEESQPEPPKEEASKVEDGAEEKPAVSPADTVVTAKVMLGTPGLTAGIPGDGPLDVAEIEAWLQRDENHVPLEIELPMGLSAGKEQIQGIDKNPMTRAKIELGRQLYFDTRLSADDTISCASCHHPDEGYARQTQFGVGIDGQEGGRNSP
ncbi:MAG: cytochrome c peroxidase, partial [Pirellulales bacterium]